MKLNKSQIDIILPNFNSEKYIDATISSVISQSFKDWKLHIVDDGSNKKTIKKLLKFKKDKRINIYFITKNKGPAFCRNYAIKRAKSKYLAFLDSDDIWNKNKLKIQFNLMQKEKYDFTYTYYKTIGLRKNNVRPNSKYYFSSFIKDTSIATSTMMIKRNISKNVVFINTKYGDDYYYKCKLLKKVHCAVAIKKYLTFYRIRKNSISSEKLKNLLWLWRINKNYNKLSYLENLISIFSIALNSIRKYGFK